ncbi:MAG: pimeloyl-ACP methyl ester carboxylesterase [Planctomycetota bacterium]
MPYSLVAVPHRTGIFGCRRGPCAFEQAHPRQSLNPVYANIRNRQGELIATSWTPGSEGSRNLIVIGHGLTSDKDRPWSEALSRELGKVGVASLRIAFTGNGESEGSFLDSTITKEVEDLRAVMDDFEGWRMGYIGQSMGAAVGVLSAASDARIEVLVSLAGMVHTAAFATRLFGHLNPGELMLGKPGRTIGPKFSRDMESIGTVVDRAPRIRVPWLIVHGDKDDVVPITDSREIHSASNGHAEMHALAGVDHSFSGEGLEAMTSIVVPWLGKQGFPQ